MFFRKHIFVTITVCLGLGYLVGAFLQSRVQDRRIHSLAFNLKDTGLLSDSLCDFMTGQGVNLIDTLTKKDRNLLVFWSPTCSFSKEFFLHQLNEQIVGIYGIPLVNDLEYLKFYINNHSIKLPQLMFQTSNSFVPIDAPSIVATPTFVIVDDKGERLAQYVGVSKIDEMITFLYQ